MMANKLVTNLSSSVINIAVKIGNIFALVNIFGFFSAIFGKKQKYVLWYKVQIPNQSGWKWIRKTGPMSEEQCKKTIETLLKTGLYEADRFMIFLAGVDPNL